MQVLEKETLVKEPGKTVKKFFLETYGCQMNFSDSEIVASILKKEGYETTSEESKADIILMNTCAIRDNVEQKTRQRLTEFRSLKKENPSLVIGVLGCMAERLKTKLLEEENLVDIVVGPDAYRSIPSLIEEVEGGQKAINVLLSREETYADINPVRLSENGVSAFISITRGCDNMCTFCVVPFTRGRERSRDPHTIVKEAEGLFENGYREVTLLGQNVDSYLWYGGGLKKDFDKAGEEQKNNAVSFAKLLEMVANVSPLLRVRFSTSNPQDMTDEVLHTMQRHENICRYIHLPMQSGSSRVLKQMNRGYDRERYLDRINAIRTIIPGCGLSTDIISGFCTETEEEHKETLSLMDGVKFDYAYMFKYSERPGTLAAKKLTDDVTEEDKKRRLQEIVDLHRKHAHESNLKNIGNVYEVLVEGTSKKSTEDLYGRTTYNKVIVFPKEHYKAGDYVNVKVNSCTSGTLIGQIVK
ncbi:MAG TPA: tRNA (N6-isopentenyl adenosine(37)-C2)-methylthiotransferase MiaB [Bacteroidia bacterium]|nr:tRNA (N6-isopentenyl adenosine(37)-C2)-methylthiotransferase MiaB [Bacteroidia bacterium]